MSTSSPITDLERINRLPWLAAADILNTAFFLLTFSGSIFLLFLDELGLGNSQIGFLLSLIPFCGIVAPFIAPVISRLGYKRVYITFWTLRKFVISLLLLTPLIIVRFGANWAFWWVAGVLLVFALCRAIAETGGYPWKKEAVPDPIRGKFTAINSMLSTVAGILVTVGASYVIGVGSGLNRYMLLISIGIVIGFISVWCYAQVPGETPTAKSEDDHGHLHGMKQALHDREFMFFLGALGLATLGGTAVISFVPLFMKEQVGLSESNVVLLNIGTYTGALLSSYLWGWAADRYGSKPIMQSSLALMLFLPIAWFLMPRHQEVSPMLAMGIAIVAGVATLAWQISWMRYLFVNAIPAEQKSPYTAVYYAWYGFVSGLGPLLAGQLLDLSHDLRADFLIFAIDPYTPLFGASIFLLSMGVVAVTQLHSAEATPFRRFAGMFVRGNPIRAIESLIQYNLSGDEMTRVFTTERMGDARNPLSSRELIEALSDPSFNVRYEAIRAIGRMPAEPELVDALLDILAQGHSELSFVVIRALGRLGDPRAIPALRQLLFSGYHMLEANSARALAMLGDEESAAHFLEKFRTERNQVLRIAYISALGKVRSGQAIAEIFAVLAQTEAEVQRGEIGLALARIAGDERYYMQQWRLLRASPTTATAQALLALHKLIKPAEFSELAALTQASAQAFAAGDSVQGVELLHQMICQIPSNRLEQTLVEILETCAVNLVQFGDTRFEIILLALHTLDLALKQLNGQ
ncbi:MAG: MFS transporter [Anaerolineae bacterium]|nr:MFS transporter [Anaerolineae bacterium]